MKYGMLMFAALVFCGCNQETRRGQAHSQGGVPWVGRWYVELNAADHPLPSRLDVAKVFGIQVVMHDAPNGRSGTVHLRESILGGPTYAMTEIQLAEDGSGVNFKLDVSRLVETPGQGATSLSDLATDLLAERMVENVLPEPEADVRTMFFDGAHLYEWNGAEWFAWNEVSFK